MTPGTGRDSEAPESRQAPGPRRRGLTAWRPWEVAVVVASAMYTAVYAWPASIQPGRWVWGGHGDALGNIVEFTWFLDAIHAGLSWQVDPKLGIPFGESLGTLPHEPLYFWAQIAIGLLAGPVVALNVISLIAVPLSAWSMYRLAFWISHSAPGAFVAGLGFGCSSYVLANTRGEPTLAQVWVFPVVILAVLKLLENPSWRRVLIAAATLVLASIVNFYYVLFLALAAAALTFAWIAVSTWRHRAFPWRPFLASLGAGALGVVATVLIYQLAVGNLAQKAGRIHRTQSTLAALSASPVDVILPPRLNPWFGALREKVFEIRVAQHPGVYTDFSELSIALPILVLAALGAAAWLLPRLADGWGIAVERLRLVAIAGVALIGAWMLVPPFGRRFGLTFLSIESDIQSIAPQYGSFYRAGILVVLAACVLAAVGVAAIAARRPRIAFAVVMIAAVGVLLENFIVTPDRVLAVDTPPEYAWITQHPGEYAIADYPLLPSGSGANEYTAEYNQRYHGHPLLNGAIGATDGESMREEMRDPNQPGVADALAALDVRYVVWHTDLIKQFAPLNPGYAAQLVGFEPHTTEYERVQSFADGATIYRVHNAGQAAVVAFYASGFGPVTAGDAAGWTRPADGTPASIGIYVNAAVRFAELRVDCQAGAAEVTATAGETSWRLVPGEMRGVDIRVETKPGFNSVPLTFAGAQGVACAKIAVTGFGGAVTSP